MPGKQEYPLATLNRLRLVISDCSKTTNGEKKFPIPPFLKPNFKATIRLHTHHLFRSSCSACVWIIKRPDINPVQEAVRVKLTLVNDSSVRFFQQKAGGFCKRRRCGGLNSPKSMSPNPLGKDRKALFSFSERAVGVPAQSHQRRQ